MEQSKYSSIDMRSFNTDGLNNNTSPIISTQATLKVQVSKHIINNW